MRNETIKSSGTVKKARKELLNCQNRISKVTNAVGQYGPKQKSNQN